MWNSTENILLHIFFPNRKHVVPTTDAENSKAYKTVSYERKHDRLVEMIPTLNSHSNLWDEQHHIKLYGILDNHCKGA